MFGDILHLDRIAQVRLVGSVPADGILEGDVGKFLGDGKPAAEFLEYAAQHGFNRIEHVFLRHKTHFNIELVELAG